MRILLHFIFLLALPNVTLIAQGAILRGTVRLQNSGGLPVENFEVTASGAEAPAFTLKNGDFKLKFPKKSPGSRVFIKLIEDKFVWTNKSQYESFYLPSNPDENEIVLEICDRMDYERNLKTKEEAIARDVKKKLDKLDNNDIATDVKLDSILKKIDSFSQDVKNTEEYQKLLAEKEQILLEKQKTEAERERLELMLLKKEENAKKLVDFNVDNASPLSQKALDAINEGGLDEALEILNLDTLNQNLALVKSNKNKIDKIKNEIDSVFDKAVQDYMVAAAIAIASYRFEDADKYYKKAIEADTLNIDNALMYSSYQLILSQKDESFLKFAELTKDLSAKAMYFFFAGYFKFINNGADTLDRKSQKYQECINLINKGYNIMKELYRKQPKEYELDYSYMIMFKSFFLIFTQNKIKNGQSFLLKRIHQLEKLYQKDNKEYGLVLSKLYGILAFSRSPKFNKKEIEKDYLRSIYLAKNALTNENKLAVSDEIQRQYKNLGLFYEQHLKDSLKAEQCQAELNSFLFSIFLKDSILFTKDLANSFSSWGEQLLRFHKDGYGKILRAIGLYERLPQDKKEGIKLNLADCYRALSNKYYFARSYDSSEFYLKKLITLEESFDQLNTQFRKMGFEHMLPKINMVNNDEGGQVIEMSLESENGKIQSSKKSLIELYSKLISIKSGQDSCSKSKFYLNKIINMMKTIDSITYEKSRYYIASAYYNDNACNVRSGILSPSKLVQEYKKCLELLAPLYHKDSIEVDKLLCLILNDLSYGFSIMQRYDSAELYFNKAYGIFKKKKQLQELEFQYDVLLTNLLDIFSKKQNYPAILNILNDKEALYKRTFQGRTLDSLLAEIYYNIGLYALYDNNYQLSEKYYTAAISKMQELMKKNTNYAFIISYCQNDLGVIYSNTKKFELAEEFLKKALFHREMLSIADVNVSIYVVQTANNLADVYIQQASKSLFFARKANKLIKKSRTILASMETGNTLKEGYSQAAQRIENKANTYILKELKEMEPLLAQIDILQEKEEISETNQEKIKHFENIYNLISEGLTKYLEHDSLYYLQTEACANLSWYYVLNKEYRRAEEVAKKALSLNINEFEWVETNLALAYLLQNNWDACVEIYDRRSSEYYDQNRKWKDVFLGDLQILKENSIEHPNIEKAINYLVNRP